MRKQRRHKKANHSAFYTNPKAFLATAGLTFSPAPFFSQSLMFPGFSPRVLQIRQLETPCSGIESSAEKDLSLAGIPGEACKRELALKLCKPNCEEIRPGGDRFLPWDTSLRQGAGSGLFHISQLDVQPVVLVVQSAASVHAHV